MRLTQSCQSTLYKNDDKKRDKNNFYFHCGPLDIILYDIEYLIIHT